VKDKGNPDSLPHDPHARWPNNGTKKEQEKEKPEEKETMGLFHAYLGQASI